MNAHFALIKRFLALFCLLASVVAVFAAETPWKDIEAAAQSGDVARLEAWVKEQGVGSTTAANILIAASGHGDRSMVDRLLGLGISASATNVHGVTPLHYSAQNGRAAMVGHLLKQGANPNAIAFCGEANCKGHTPLLWAACRQDLIMAKTLLEAGANPRTAKNMAIQKANDSGDVEMVRLLKQFGGQASGEASAIAAKAPDSTAPLAVLGLTELLPGRMILGTPAPAPAKSKGRLSVIADDSNLVLADLLTAELSGEALLEIVERQELDRILTEQKLSRQFAANSANFSRVANLLRADALLLMNERKLSGRSVVESRLIRVNPGLVLDTVYATVPVASPAEWAKRMKNHVSGLAGKVIRQDAIALSLLNIRASVSSAESRGLDRTLAVLLSDRLTHQPQFICLERAAMERLMSEHSGPFRAGSFLVDGTVEPALDGSGGFKLSIRFQPAGQGETLTFNTTGRRADPAPAVDELLAQINARLGGATSAVRRDTAAEAHEYSEESRWAIEAGQPVLAQSAAEAAWALGLRTVDVARLRVLAAMRSVRDQRDPGAPGTAASLDLALHGLTVWREMLPHQLLQNRPDELRRWLEFGLEMSDDAVLAILRITTANDQIQQADRLESLRDLIWASLHEVWARAESLPPGTRLANAASEKQAAMARLLLLQPNRFLQAARTLLNRKFTQNDTLTRARIRSNLLLYWTFARVMVPSSRGSSGSVTLSLPPGIELSHQLAAQLRNATEPEDRYVAALLTLRAASLRQESTPANLDQLRSILFDMAALLAEGGEVFQLYWERFEALDKLDGVPFFAINRTFSPNKDRMWERHTPEHTEFRRQLFLRVCKTAKAPASDFQSLVSIDQYTPEQAAEVAAAQRRLGGRPVSLAPIARSESPPRSSAVRPSQPTLQPGPARAPEPVPPPAPANEARPLTVQRLWHPFDLGLEMVPEFRADFVTMTSSEGRLWLHGCTLDVGGQPDQHYLFVIEPESMRTETLPIPERSSKLNARILVTPTHLLFVSEDLLAIRDRGAAIWDTYKEIKSANLNPPVLVGDTLYLVVSEPPGNALIGFSLSKRRSEVLASTRRRPPASPLDDPNLEIKSIATSETGDIVVNAGNVRQSWNPAKRLWTALPPQRANAAASPKLPQPQSEYGRVGAVRKVGGVVGVHFNGKYGPVSSIPLEFARPARIYLPDSRYGPQNIRPEYCNAFPGGLLLVPSSGSGFWIISQKEIDDYLKQNGLASGSTTAAVN